MKYKFKIKGLDCAGCAAQLEHAMGKIEGVESVSISFMTERLILECQEEKKEAIMEKMRKVIKKEEPDVKLEEM